MKVLKFSDSEDGEIHGELTTEVDKKITIKRLGSGSELSEEELEALIEKAMEVAEGEIDIDFDHDTETVYEDITESGDTRIVVKRIKRTETSSSSETDSE